MRVFDMEWAKHPECFVGGLLPRIKDDAPEEVRKSFEHYLKQSKEVYGKKPLHNMCNGSGRK